MDANQHSEKPNQAPGQEENKLKPQPELGADGKPTRAQRMKDGKKGLLFAVYLEYYENSRSNELKLEVLKNLYWDEILDIRHNAPTIGVMIGISPGQWRLIMPQNIDALKVERQNNYFDR